MYQGALGEGCEIVRCMLQRKLGCFFVSRDLVVYDTKTRAVCDKGNVVKRVVFLSGLSIMMAHVDGTDKAFMTPMRSPLTNSRTNNRSILRNLPASRPSTPVGGRGGVTSSGQIYPSLENRLNSEGLATINENNQEFSRIDHNVVQNTTSISDLQSNLNLLGRRMQRQFDRMREPRIVQLFNQQRNQSSHGPVVRVQTCISFCVTTQTPQYIGTYSINSTSNSTVSRFRFQPSTIIQHDEVPQNTETAAPYNSAVQPSAPSIDLLNASTSQTIESSDDEDDIPPAQNRGKRKAKTSAFRSNTKKRR